MNRIKLLTFGVLLATSATAVQAESKISVGAGVGIAEQPYKQYDHDIIPIPVINYESDNFWFHGLGGGYYLWNDDADKLSVMGYWSPLRFKSNDSDDHQLRSLDDRKSTMMMGLSWLHNTQYGSLRTSLAGDVLDNSDGIVGDLAWIYRYTQGDLTLTPGIGVQWSSEDQNQYYYGVSRHESSKSGLRHYDPNDSWSPYLELTASYRLAENWNVFGAARYTRLSDEVTDSPMVDKSWAGILSTGVTYSF